MATEGLWTLVLAEWTLSDIDVDEILRKCKEIESLNEQERKIEFENLYSSYE